MYRDVDNINQPETQQEESHASTPIDKERKSLNLELVSNRKLNQVRLSRSMNSSSSESSHSLTNPSHSIMEFQKPQHDPVLRECSVVLNRLSSADILKWRKQNNSDPVLRECRVILNRLSLADILKWQRPENKLANTHILSSPEPINPSLNSLDEQQALREGRLDVQEPRALSVPSLSLSSMGKVICRQQQEIEKLKHEWNQKQCRIDQLEESIRNLNVAHYQQIANEVTQHEHPSTPNTSTNQGHNTRQTTQESTKTSEPSRPSEEEKVENKEKQELKRKSGRRSKLGADFSSIYHELGDTNCFESESEQRPSVIQLAKKSRKSPGNSTPTVVSNSLTCGQVETSYSFESTKPEVTPPLRFRVIPTRELIEKSAVFHDVGSHSVKPSRVSSRLWVPPPIKPPIPRLGSCFSCYEKYDLMYNRRHCEKCLSKLSRLKKTIKNNLNVDVPQCTHKLNVPMRGCEGCIIQSLIRSYNLFETCRIPYNVVDVSRNLTSQRNVSDLSSYQVDNIAQDKILRLSSFPVEHTRPQPGIFETVDSSVQKSCLHVLPGQASNQILNTASKASKNTLQDLSLPSLLRDNEWAKQRVVLDMTDSTYGTTLQKAVTKSATLPVLTSLLHRPSLSNQCEQIQNSHQGVVSSISNPLSSQTSSLSKKPSTKKKRVSVFPDDWFLVIPDKASELPIPHTGFCYSCYEPKSKLIQKYCRPCWHKAKRLRQAWLMDPNTPNPQCNHPLNRPMRGCEACILGAFIVRYNLQFPDARFPVPYNKVCLPIAHNKLNSCNEATITNVPKYFPNRYAGFSFLLNPGCIFDKPSEQPAGTGAASDGIPDSTISQNCGLITNFPAKWFEVVPHDPNELPTPRINHCISCYESKIIQNGYCEECRSAAKIMANIYIDKPDITLPRCIHQLNLPMRGCPSCILRAYILTYNKCNPDKPYAIPYEKINSECLLLRNHQNIGHLTRNNSDQYLSDLSELGTVAPPGLQPKQTTGMVFPCGWFQKVPNEEHRLPLPRRGCCHSCYEHKTTVDHCYITGLNIGGHCLDCSMKAEALVVAYQSGVYSLPQCTHTLNVPMRGCEGCIIRAFIVRHNQRNPQKLFPVPYKLFDFKSSSSEGFESPVKTLPPLEHMKSVQNGTATSYSIVSECSTSGIHVKHEAVNDEHSFIGEQNDSIPNSGITVFNGMSREPVPYPWSTETYDENYPSTEPVPNPGSEVMYDGNHDLPTEPAQRSTMAYDSNELSSDLVPNHNSTVTFNENHHCTEPIYNAGNTVMYDGNHPLATETVQNHRSYLMYDGNDLHTEPSQNPGSTWYFVEQ